MSWLLITAGGFWAGFLLAGEFSRWRRERRFRAAEAKYAVLLECERIWIFTERQGRLP